MESLRGGLSHRESLEVSSGVCRGQGSGRYRVCRGQGSHIHDRHTGCRWRFNPLMCAGVRGLQI